MSPAERALVEEIVCVAQMRSEAKLLRAMLAATLGVVFTLIGGSFYVGVKLTRIEAAIEAGAREDGQHTMMAQRNAERIDKLQERVTALERPLSKP